MDNPQGSQIRPNSFEEAFAQKIAAETAASHDASISNNSNKKTLKIIIIIAVVLIVLGVLAFLLFFMEDSPIHLSLFDTAPTNTLEENLEEVESVASIEEVKVDKQAETPTKKFYSTLSGEEISDESLNSSPTYCIQIPNGVDGARPQAGLNEAKIVFEAIAEAGITRFAAIFQNPTVSAIGPIRSLRIYYFDWDLPFDCTVVHAGGASDAISALNSSNLKNHDENVTYMWRSAKNGNLNRMWNNLFTSSEKLAKFSQDKSYLTSDVKSFPRLKPETAELARIKEQVVHKLDIDEEADGNTDELAPKVTKINIKIGNMPTFNPVYNYNVETNSYDRSYATGVKHEVYNCLDKTNNITPEINCGTPIQLSPKVVIAMMVREGKQSDNYHEDITTIGYGDAVIFQNGIAIEGSWEKSAKASQIIFRDKENNEIELVPGQTWITAVPTTYSGNVSYE